ncbi:hypothetical protein ADU59_06210 [Pararhizobium polonicum]|uniref:Uncharacterized protein n=1 Tax=Pararhizobium polonicum TaxID=1612624 RepID=A0A1C7P3W4_9HYPH|nr:hypothetical protein [Pararhizobium polonicum]OBZ95982.1 hypothetical protein ADU59_06210 [Pararhizobium polonicum]
MTFTLLKLEGGNRSLEFDEADLPVLAAFLQRNFAEPDMQEQAIHTNLVIAGTRLMYYNEWGDLCLIWLDEKGALLLDSIFTRLSAGEA